MEPPNPRLYEGYCDETPVHRLRERFGTTNVYGRNSRSILSPASGYIKAYDFTLNPYRGCQYGCSYCYAAAFSPNTRMRRDWGNWVIVKENAAELLRKELERWNKRHPERPPRIYMSTVTDPYQAIETREKLTQRLLEVMIEYCPVLVIQTRSPMVTRDIPLFQRLKKLRVNMSVPTGSETVRRDFEPQSPSLKARLHAIRKIAGAIDPDKGYVPKLSVTITPTLPTKPEDIDWFVERLRGIDRVVLQRFHDASARSLVAATREEAIALKEKYRWWYADEGTQYEKFKAILKQRLPETEVLENQEGFGYD